jgi:hypothetical protein
MSFQSNFLSVIPNRCAGVKAFLTTYSIDQQIPEVYDLYCSETASKGESIINIIGVYQYDINSRC